MPGAPSGHRADHDSDELMLASRVVGQGVRQNELSVPSIHCGACVARIERVLGDMPGVERARVNLSTRRVIVAWRGDAPPPLVAALNDAGFDAHLHESAADEKDGVMGELVRALAVAGFASANVMMLSVGVWSGADDGSRDVFHWLSAAIALPTVAYSGRVFFRSAWQAICRGHTNMDVPISVGVLLTFGMSLYETVQRGPHAYFDAAVSLLFVLLIGRTLDHVMRERARTAIKGLARLAARGAWVVEPDGTRHYLAVDAIRVGMTILLAAGDRVPVDARIVEGRSALDVSLVSGESLPQSVAPGALLQAGTLNLTGPLKIEAVAAAGESFLAEMMRMMEAAEAGRAGYRRLADRAARLYAPVIHMTAFAAFVGWTLATGDAHRALTIAIAVLIITCPCALGLAVPMVQVVAARRLFEHGIMVKGGGALERLAEVDHVVFDKTGTLTSGVPELADRGVIDPDLLAVAAAMAAHSRHPYSQAIAAEGQARNARVVMLTDLVEHAGAGLEGRVGDTVYRLGRADWACGGDARPGLALSAGGLFLCSFRFRDELRPGAREVVAALLARRISVEILSGDHEEPVCRLASSLNVPWRAAVSPAGKVEHIAALAGRGHRVLMVGDGLNDAPSLAAAHVSMAPASAVDIGRNAADLVFLRNDLTAVSETIRTADEAARLVRQNFLLAAVYNALAVPVAVLGYVTPLIAAFAMSASSIVVICNALRLGKRTRDRSVVACFSEVPPARAVEAGR